MVKKPKTVEALGDPNDDSYVSTGTIRTIAQLVAPILVTIATIVGFKDATGNSLDPEDAIAVLSVAFTAGVGVWRFIEARKGKRIL